MMRAFSMFSGMSMGLGSHLIASRSVGDIVKQNAYLSDK